MKIATDQCSASTPDTHPSGPPSHDPIHPNSISSGRAIPCTIIDAEAFPLFVVVVVEAERAGDGGAEEGKRSGSIRVR